MVFTITFSVGRVLKTEGRVSDGFLGEQSFALIQITSHTPTYFYNHSLYTVSMVTWVSRVPSTLPQDFVGNQGLFSILKVNYATLLWPNSIYNFKRFLLKPHQNLKFSTNNNFWSTKAKITLVESVIIFCWISFYFKVFIWSSNPHESQNFFFMPFRL